MESVALAPTHSLVLDVPVLLLTLDGAIARVPTAVIHRLFLAVIALTHKPHFTTVTILLCRKMQSFNRHRSVELVLVCG